MLDYKFSFFGSFCLLFKHLLIITALTASRKRKYNGCCDWANLPKDLLYFICNKLNLADFLAFSYVCHEWRKSFLETKHIMASQAPLMSFITTRGRSNFYRNNWLGVSSGFLIFGDNIRNIWIKNPITGQELKFSKVPQPINQWYRYDQAIVASIESYPGRFLIAVLSRTRWSSKVCFCVSGYNAWFSCSSGPSNPQIVMEIVIFKGRIFALTSDFRIGVFDLSCCELLVLNLKGTPALRIKRTRLGVSKDKLLIIDSGNLPGFKVYWIDFANMKWREMESLGDESLFMGYKMSARLCNATKWGRRSNFIYQLPFISKTCSEISLDGKKAADIPICPENVSPKMNFWYFLHHHQGMDSVRSGF